MNTRIVIKNNKFGNSMIEVINDDLSKDEKLKIKYEVYKNINVSYQNLLKHLPKTDGKD